MKQQLRKIVCRIASPYIAKDRGPVVCAGMVRNEIDIIDVWVAHLHAVFDRVIIYDHLSTDGTRQRLHELAKRYPKLELREYDEPGYNQSGLMTAVFHEIAAASRRGWMFFLDADEFIMVEDRQKFLELLDRHRAATTINLTWSNALPAAVCVWGGGRQLSPRHGCRVGKRVPDQSGKLRSIYALRIGFQQFHREITA